MTGTPPDPMAAMRDWLGQWEAMANRVGGDFLQRPETAQALGGATSAALQMQAMTQEMMAKVLAAAHLPSKADIDAIGARLAAIEASLARIEAGGASSSPVRPGVKRTKQPPAKG